MKFALVTGGSGAIGRAICTKLASEGYHILVHYHSNKTAAENIQTSIIENGGKAELISFDVSDLSATKTAITQWKTDHPDDYIAVLVNNAGKAKDALLFWMEAEDWTEVINTNLNSFYHVTTQVLKDMVMHKFGRVINVVSLSGQKGLPGQTNYAAAKAGVIGATKSLAQEVGKKKITVNAVAPGYIKSEMTQDLDEKELKKLIPVNRFGKAEEVAATVAFLASEGAAYITGEVISINGGLYT